MATPKRVALLLLGLLFCVRSVSAIDAFVNFGRVTVLTGYTAAATSIALVAGHGARLPATTPYNAVWYNATDYPDPSDDPSVEIVRVTARVTDTLTITRAQEGTLASAHNRAGKTYALIATITAKTFTEIDALTLNELAVLAVGDGVADDTAAIQAAIDESLGPTGTCQPIHLRAGAYKITSQLNFYDTATPGPKDCGILYGDGGVGSVTSPGTRILWNGPYWQSPIRPIGSNQQIRDLSITAQANWIAGIDYSGSNGTFVGSVPIGRASSLTIRNVFINCAGFHGDNVNIGRFGFQSDMLMIDQSYVTNCNHGTAIASFNSNTQSMKVVGGTVAHAHIGFRKNTTTNFSVFGTEMDDLNVVFVPSGGGSVNVVGGREENAQRFYYDSSGSSAGPRLFDGVQFANVTTTRATTTATTYTTLATPASPVVVATGSGASTWGYKVACFDSNGYPNTVTGITNGHTASSAEVTATNADTLSASVYNTITFTASPGSSMCWVYRTSVGVSPATTGAIAIVPNWEAGSVVDTGFPGDGTTPPTTDTTTPTVVLSTAGFIEGDNVAIAGAGAVAAAGVLRTTLTLCYDLLHCRMDATPTADVVAASLVMYGDGCTASMSSSVSPTTVTLTTPCVSGNALITVVGAGAAGANLATTLTAGSCTFPGATMVCTGSGTALTTVSGALVASPTYTYWQNFFLAQQSGPYSLRGNYWNATNMQISSSHNNNLLVQSNTWTDTTQTNPLGLLAFSCTQTQLNNFYAGASATPMPNCVSPSMPFSGTSVRTALGGDVTLLATDPTYQFLSCSVANCNVTLPVAVVNLAFVFKNIGGSNTLTIKDSIGATVTTIAAGSSATPYYEGTAWQVL